MMKRQRVSVFSKKHRTKVSSSLSVLIQAGHGKRMHLKVSGQNKPLGEDKTNSSFRGFRCHTNENGKFSLSLSL